MTQYYEVRDGYSVEAQDGTVYTSGQVVGLETDSRNPREARQADGVLRSAGGRDAVFEVSGPKKKRGRPKKKTYETREMTPEPEAETTGSEE